MTGASHALGMEPWAVAQKPFDAAARQSFTREVAASHLVSPSRLQVTRQSYILEVSHIHLCDWRRSLSTSQQQVLKQVRLEMIAFTLRMEIT